ncbi:MAG: hypothetical protein ACTSUE_08185 [Promethearchaeota archaeon]
MSFRIITFVSEWDEDEGPKIIDEYPKARKLDLEDITMQIFTSFQTVFGYDDDVSFDRTNLVLPLKSHKRTAKILLDAYRNKKVRGGKLPFIVAFLVPLKFVQRELHIYNEIQEKIVDTYSKEKKIKLKEYFEEILQKTEGLALSVRSEAESLLKKKMFVESIEKFRISIFLFKLAKNKDEREDTLKKMEVSISKYSKEILYSVNEEIKKGNFKQAEKNHRLTVRLAKEVKNEKMIEIYTKKLNEFYVKWIKGLEKQGKAALKAGGDLREVRKLYDKIIKLAQKTKNEKLVSKYQKQRDKLP